MLETMKMLPYVALPAFFHKKQEYRLHRIRTRRRMDGAVATIYDGETVVHEVSATDIDRAIESAKAWIDEQDEYEAEFDLHTASYVH